MSIDLINNSDFVTFGFEHRLIQGAPHYVVIAKQSYWLGKNGELSKKIQSPKQIRFENEMQTNERTSSVFLPTDLVPFKSFAEIIVNGVARTIEKKQQWLTNITINNLLTTDKSSLHWQKSVLVTGKRQWLRHTLGWTLSDMEFTNEVRLSYENAYGGSFYLDYDLNNKTIDPDFPPIFTYANNPSGVGWLPNKKHIQHYEKENKLYDKVQQHSLKVQLQEKTVIYAPQLYTSIDIATHIRSPEDVISVAGYGSVLEFWQPRLKKIEHVTDWLAEETKGGYPLEFDKKYWQQAPENQWLPAPLKGGEVLQISGIFKEGRQTYTLPKHLVFIKVADEISLPIKLMMKIDTLVIDTDERVLEIIWRHQVDLSHYHYLDEEDATLDINFFAFELDEYSHSLVQV